MTIASRIVVAGGGHLLRSRADGVAAFRERRAAAQCGRDRAWGGGRGGARSAGGGGRREALFCSRRKQRLGGQLCATSAAHQRRDVWRKGGTTGPQLLFSMYLLGVPLPRRISCIVIYRWSSGRHGESRVGRRWCDWARQWWMERACEILARGEKKK